MTVGKILEQFDAVKVNEIGDSVKIGWLSEVEGKAYSSEWLNITTAAAGAWSFLLIVIVPCTAISYGIVTRYQRKKAK